MARRISTGIDIGTHQTKVVVVEEVDTPEGSQLRILGTGIAESRGMRHGYVVDPADVTESIRAARARDGAGARPSHTRSRAPKLASVCQSLLSDAVRYRSRAAGPRLNA